MNKTWWIAIISGTYHIILRDCALAGETALGMDAIPDIFPVAVEQGLVAGSIS